MKEAHVETIHDGHGPYLSRAKLFGGRLRLHIFHRGDSDPDCHDHPADFWTFPLTSYIEEYIEKDGSHRLRVVKAFRLHRRKAEHAHRVIGRFLRDGAALQIANPGQIATICWFGKYRREWGFNTLDHGWMPWRDYEAYRGRGAT